MDKVRLGRALGYGARHAARTLVEVTKAAAAPDPADTRPAEPVLRSGGKSPDAAAYRGAATRAPRPSILAPVRKFSSVLWLEVTGAFFALIALFLGLGAWKLRAVVRGGAAPEELHHFIIFMAGFALFAYFAVSGFARAHRRDRR